MQMQQEAAAKLQAQRDQAMVVVDDIVAPAVQKQDV